MFFITDADNHPLSDPQLCSRLQEAIIKQLSVNSQPSGEMRLSI